MTKDAMIAGLLNGEITRVRRDDAIKMLKHAGYVQLPDGAIARNRARNASVAFQYGDDMSKHIVIDKQEFVVPSVINQIKRQFKELGFPRETSALLENSDRELQGTTGSAWQQNVSSNGSSREL